MEHIKKRCNLVVDLEVSTSWSGLGLCPTRDRPDDIGFPTRRPASDCKNPQVKSDQTWLVGSRVGRSWKYAAGGSNWRQLDVFLAGSSLDLSQTTQSEQNNTIFLPNFSKKLPNFLWIWEKLTRSVPYLSETQ